MSALTIVMYHYVRDLAHSRYPGLKARSIEEFDGQLDYLTRHYRVCSTRDVLAAARGERVLPPNACLLTFDDGFLDHFAVVFPRLVDRGLSGSFYPPVAAVEERRVLDTHKVQIVLAEAPDHGKVARRILDMLEDYRGECELPSADALYRQYAQVSRFDGPEVMFIKRVLQRGLPEAVRAAITGRLFDEYAGADEPTVAGELYMDLSQLRTMVRFGMEVGGHGAEHVWLDSLGYADQAAEIARTAAFLARVHGQPPADWVMCYPFGAYNADTLSLLPAAGCALGLTTRVDLAMNLCTPLELPRLDTNDLPLGGEALANEWTRRSGSLGGAPVKGQHG
jgi:peptidoglycan/xylan/chitin deacetylase (PgdA/CDA1 family)